MHALLQMENYIKKITTISYLVYLLLIFDMYLLMIFDV